MAINPIIHNDGGVNRFLDYLSTVPEFLKVEDDVVAMLQLFSDYINNAYRNTAIVDKFRFKLIATDNNVVAVQNSLKHLQRLFTLTEERGLKMLYLSKPQGNPRSGTLGPNPLPEDWPIFREYIRYEGTLESLSTSIISVPSPEDGDKFFIEFTREGETENTGVYILNTTRNLLQLDPNGSSQDPFNNTINQPFFTDVGLAPRMLEFNVADIGAVAARRAARDDTVTYYEVFFDATIYNINDVTSIITKTVNNNATNNQDFKYVVDYYDVLDNIPSSYAFRYQIGFAQGCQDIDWDYNDKTQQYDIQGLSLFYARDLTNIDISATLFNREGRNIYNDPSFNLNTSANDIIEIIGNGIDVTITTRFRQSLAEGDDITIIGTQNFNGNYVVSKILAYNKFRFTSTIAGNETKGKVVTRNLFYSKIINNPNDFDLVVPYTRLNADREFEENDFVSRLINDIDPLWTTFSADNVNIDTDQIQVKSLNGFPNIPSSTSLKVTIRGNGTGTLPVGLTEGIIYDMFINDKDRRLVSFSGVDITAIGTGTFSIYYLGNGRKYFDATTDVDLVNETITLNNLTNLKVGSNVYFRVGTPDEQNNPNVTLPTPLEILTPYQISEIDMDNNTIKLDGIDLSVLGNGICDMSIILPVEGNNGRIESLIIDNPVTNIFDGSGRITLKSFSGDMISQGFIGRYQQGALKAFAQIDTTAVKWTSNQLFNPTLIGGEPATFPLYKKGDLVVYQGVQYRVVVPSIKIGINSQPPTNEPQNYERFMDSIISRPTEVIYNPYMFGLNRTFSLGFEEDIDFNRPYSVLGNEMYVQQVEDLALRYGFDQREWLFNPRFAPQDIVVRNGSLSFVQNQNELYDPVNNELAALSISKANTVQNNSLFGVNTPIQRTINSLTTASGIVSVQTVGSHGYKTGTVITVQGSSLPETNGSFIITVTGLDTFTYEIPNPAVQIGAGIITCIYQPNVGDFINVVAQTVPSENGIYEVRVGTWKKYDDTKLPEPSIVFCKQNLFTVGELNPEIAKGTLLNVSSLVLVAAGVVQVTTDFAHGYTVGTTFEIRDAFEGDYNGRFEVEVVVNEFTFQYNIGDALTPSSPATGNITCQADGWYQYRLDEIQWQKISKFDENDFKNSDGSDPVEIPFNDGNDNVDLLFGTYTFVLEDDSTIKFTDGLIVELNDQLIDVENGVYRVNDNALWTRLDTKLAMKVRDIRINGYDNPDFVGIELDEEEVIYRVFSDADVEQYINTNISSSNLVYKASYPFVQDFEFIYEKVENIDTAGSVDREYDARKDYNSVVNTFDMSPDFTGIPDMDYPLVEKIERLAYNKDPRVIDINLIGYLARYMGYDITGFVEDITSSPYYSNQQEIESAIRRAVEQLPQYYALKSTKSGLELLLLTFGIVGELVTKWTPQEAPYSEFIPDYELRGREYADMLEGIRSSYVPTPHFNINVNIAGNFENQILQGDNQRLLSAIKRFKPINTVFDGICQYIKTKLKARISISKMNAKGKQKVAIGFENLDWDEDLIQNDCL